MQVNFWGCKCEGDHNDTGEGGQDGGRGTEREATGRRRLGWGNGEGWKGWQGLGVGGVGGEGKTGRVRLKGGQWGEGDGELEVGNGKGEMGRV